MILDVISLIIVLLFAIIGLKTGAAKAVCRLLSVILAFFLAVFISHFLAEVVYNVFVKQTIINNVSVVINDPAMATASEKAAGFLSSVPVFLANALGYFGVDEVGVTELFSTSTVDSVEQVVMTPVVGVISIIIFVILFIVLLFLLKKAFDGIAKLFRLPVIRIADSLAGFVLGLLEGLLAVYVFAFALRIVIPLTGGDIFLFNEAYISESMVFSLFYFGGLNTIIQSFIYSFSNI